MEEQTDKLRRANAVGHRLAGGGKGRDFNQRKLARTLLLGTLAVAAAIYWLAVEYDVNRRELLDYFGASILFVVALLAVSVAGAAVFWALKRSIARVVKWRRRG